MFDQDEAGRRAREGGERSRESERSSASEDGGRLGLRGRGQQVLERLRRVRGRVELGLAHLTRASHWNMVAGHWILHEGGRDGDWGLFPVS